MTDHKYTAWLSFEADQELSQPLPKITLKRDPYAKNPKQINPCK